MPDYRSLSLWHDTVGESLQPRRGMPGDTDADVAIVGAGYTGLWTAYYLKKHQPDLRVVVVESEIAERLGLSRQSFQQMLKRRQE